MTMRAKNKEFLRNGKKNLEISIGRNFAIRLKMMGLFILSTNY
jgi:hypothetical protein